MRHVLVMGVCGCGKSSIAQPVADALGAVFVEGDDFHTDENRVSMQAGRPLTDEMRMGWLDAIAAHVRTLPGRAVIACSALRSMYRDRLAAQIGDPIVVHLTGTPALLTERVSGRPDHFMPASLVASQFDTLEPPSGPSVVEIDVALAPQDVIDRAIAHIRSQTSGSTT